MRNIIFKLILVISIFIFTKCSSDSPKETETSEKYEKVLETGNSTNLLKYSLLNEEVDDNIAKTQVAWNILLQDKKISKEGIKTLLSELYDQIKSRKGFKYHEYPTAIYIYAYNSKDKANAGTGQWIGMLSKNHDDPKPQISISETQLKAVSLIVEERFGFKEQVRQDIWKKYCRIELRAQRDADEKLPINHPEATFKDLEKNAQLVNTLEERYRKELAKEYNTTVVILDSISNEGINKGWTIPGL